VTVIESALLNRAGFAHGFGTRLIRKGDLPSDIHILKQVHGERIVCLKEQTMRVESGKGKVEREKLNLIVRGLPEEPFRFDEGDALVSAVPGTAIGIRTADCLPLLVGDPARGTAAAVHCGWRSLALDLPRKVIRLMIAGSGTSPTTLIAVMGPAIGICCYEVGPEVVELFQGHDTDGKPYTEVGERNFLDLRAVTRSQLLQAGLVPGNIDDLTECVACQPERFYSHRARRSKKRMVSFIRARGERTGRRSKTKTK
jgi:YfiH family protein